MTRTPITTPDGPAVRRSLRKGVIACAISALLGFLGGLIGHDLSPFAKPAADLANDGVDAVEGKH